MEKKATSTTVTFAEMKQNYEKRLAQLPDDEPDEFEGWEQSDIDRYLSLMRGVLKRFNHEGTLEPNEEQEKAAMLREAFETVQAEVNARKNR